MDRETTIPFFPEQASTFASDLDNLYFFLVAVSVFFVVAIGLAIVVLALRYNRKKELDKGDDVHGNNVLEIVWSVVPLILAMVMFFWGARLYFDYSKAPEDSMELLVTGKQWMWKIQHSNGKREVNALTIPVGRPIQLTMTSEDVIHSFFIPAFRTKSDVVPGRYTKTWFTPTKVGRYHLFCAEYCGTEHSQMVGFVNVLNPTDYEMWLTDGTASTISPEEAGSKLFAELGCATCHMGGANAQGPSIAKVYGQEREFTDGSIELADDNYLRNSILNPQQKIVKGYYPIMPTFKGIVSETQLMQLIAYIKSVAELEPAGDEG